MAPVTRTKGAPEQGSPFFIGCPAFVEDRNRRGHAGRAGFSAVKTIVRILGHNLADHDHPDAIRFHGGIRDLNQVFA